MPEATKDLGEEIAQSIQANLDQVLYVMDLIVNEYWLAWRMQNQKLEEAEKYEGKYLRGSIAPRKYESSGKWYIEWYYYPPGRYGGRNKSWGTKIKPRRGPRYYGEQFKSRAQEWEFAMIMDTETKLRPLRYMLEALHKSKVAIIRSTNNIKEDNLTEINGE